MQLTLTEEEQEVLRAIWKLKVASEVELQSITLLDTDELKSLIKSLEKKDLVKFDYSTFSTSGQGDGVMITDLGMNYVS